MAAPLYVKYTPQVSGDHVICYQQTSPNDDGVNFCCFTVNITPGMIGFEQILTVPDVLLDCAGNAGTGTGGTPWDGVTPTNFNGYVYPVCNPDLKVLWGPVLYTTI